MLRCYQLLLQSIAWRMSYEDTASTIRLVASMEEMTTSIYGNIHTKNAKYFYHINICFSTKQLYHLPVVEGLSVVPTRIYANRH